MQTKSIALLISVVFSTAAFAQKAKVVDKTGKGTLRFRKEHIDLGEIKEEGGEALASFVFYNIGQHPVTISNVKSSCGCTVADWPKDTIQAGDSGIVVASYDPRTRPGPFEKALWVYTDAVPFQYFLTIGGTVIPRPKTIEDDYPSKFGHIMMTNNYFNLGFISENKVDTVKARFYNKSDKVVTITGITGRPAHLLIEASSKELLPHQETVLTLIYDAKAANTLGDMLHYMKLMTDDPAIPEIQMHVQAHILEDFPKQTWWRERRNPVVGFEETDINFGKALKGDTVVLHYTIRNDGKRPLRIRRMTASCGCAASTVDKDVIKRGETGVIEVKFFTAGRSGIEKKTITVITNDPAHPISKIRLEGEVVENPNAL